MRRKHGGSPATEGQHCALDEGTPVITAPKGQTVAHKLSVLLGCLVALAGLYAAADHYGPQARAERVCTEGLAELRVSVQLADQDMYPGQRSLHISARDGSFSHIRGVRPSETGSAEQIWIEDCIAGVLNPDD